MAAELVAEIAFGLVGSGILGVTGYTAARVVDLHREVGEIKATITTHVAQEDIDRAEVKRDLEEFRKKLPNGEMHEALAILRTMAKKPARRKAAKR